MPIYECYCEQCNLEFEVLARTASSDDRHDCPECGRSAPRLVSTFAIGRSTKNSSGVGSADVTTRTRKTGTPLCLQYPQLPLLCHMDEGSAQRFIAHFNGHGNEYDDRMAAHEEKRKQLGIQPRRSRQLGHPHAHAAATSRPLQPAAPVRRPS